MKTELKQENKMREIEISKIVLSSGATGEKLEKAVKLLKLISGMAPLKIKSRKRIPSLGVRPGLEVGCKVTIRKNVVPLLKKFWQAINNEINERQIENNHFSFGIDEYIEIPGMEYQRDIGILGFNVTVDFERKGKRTERKKIKKEKVPKKQNVSKEEIIEYMKKNFDIKIIGSEK